MKSDRIEKEKAKLDARFSGSLSEIIDTLKRRNQSEIDRLRIFSKRRENLDHTAIEALNTAIDGLETANNAVAILSVAFGHNLEENEVLKSIIEDMANTGTLYASLSAIADITGDVMQNAPIDEWREKFSELDEDRQRKLMPELFME